MKYSGSTIVPREYNPIKIEITLETLGEATELVVALRKHGNEIKEGTTRHEILCLSSWLNTLLNQQA